MYFFHATHTSVNAVPETSPTNAHSPAKRRKTYASLGAVSAQPVEPAAEGDATTCQAAPLPAEQVCSSAQLCIPKNMLRRLVLS